MIGVGGPSQLWAVSPLGRWSWEEKKIQVEQAMGR